MNKIITLINNNPNIESELKTKIIECTRLIINKYPICYELMYKNLQTVTIGYPNEEYTKKLNNYKVDSVYNAKTNTIFYNKNIINTTNYKHMIIHGLLHLASCDNKYFIGFESLLTRMGISFNEGITEYLTSQILNTPNYAMGIYANDINNVLLLSSIIPIDKLIEIYFKQGLGGLIKEYYSKLKVNNFEEMIKLMDLDFIERVRKNNFNNEYKDKYILLFIEDISNLEYSDDLYIINLIKNINDYIKFQYKTDIVPPNIKEGVEKLYKIIINKSSFTGGSKHG